MVKLRISASKLKGHIVIPPSKSHTIRALLFALMAHGQSCISNPLSSPDTEAMIGAIRQLGAKVERKGNCLVITGTGGRLTPAKERIDCGNSGQVLRFIGALAGLSSFPTTLVGDPRRPIQPLVSALNQLGAFATTAPFVVQGPFLQSKATLAGEDSQPVSGLLIAASFAPHPIALHVTNPGETPWIDLTLYWLKRFQIPVENEAYTTYRLQGNASIQGFSYTVPADFSSAAYAIAAALVTQSELTHSPLDMEDPQGDKALLPHLKQGFSGRIDVNPFIDALPILAVVACFAKVPTELVNGAIARHKESDRIHAIAHELMKMGARLEERPDGLLIYPSELRGSLHLASHGDHRIALSLAIAALAATGESTIHGVEVIAKSYPHFVEDFQSVGAKMEIVP